MSLDFELEPLKELSLYQNLGNLGPSALYCIGKGEWKVGN